MFCTECGTQCDDQAVFCTNCGAPLKAEPSGSGNPAQPVNAVPVPPVNAVPVPPVNAVPVPPVNAVPVPPVNAVPVQPVQQNQTIKVDYNMNQYQQAMNQSQTRKPLSSNYKLIYNACLLGMLIVALFFGLYYKVTIYTAGEDDHEEERYTISELKEDFNDMMKLAEGAAEMLDRDPGTPFFEVDFILGYLLLIVTAGLFAIYLLVFFLSKNFYRKVKFGRIALGVGIIAWLMLIAFPYLYVMKINSALSSVGVDFSIYMRCTPYMWIMLLVAVAAWIILPVVAEKFYRKENFSVAPASQRGAFCTYCGTEVLMGSKCPACGRTILNS